MAATSQFSEVGSSSCAITLTNPGTAASPLGMTLEITTSVSWRPLRFAQQLHLAQRAEVTLDGVAPAVENVRDLANRPAFLPQPPDARSSSRHLAVSSAEVWHGYWP
jgi:hypothetical protein